MTISRRTILKTGAAAAALPLLGSRAFAQAVIDGSWVSSDQWPGIKEGEVQIGPYNESIPADVVAAAEAVKNGQADGSMHIFTGPIKDNTGAERVAAGVVMTDAELLSMDWYVEGVNPPA